jgi:hypothetical protein
MKRFLLATGYILPISLLVATLNADTLVLRDGRRINGQLISVQNGVVDFYTSQPFGGGRTLRVARNEILGIEFTDDGHNEAPSSAPAFQGRRPSGLRERQVIIPANVRAVDTNIDVQMGQDIYIEAAGEVTWKPGRRDGPGGEQNSPINANRPMPNRPAASLIGSVGSSDYFFIGLSGGAIRMRSSGRLFLMVNDDYLQDNSGSFRVVVFY